MHIRSRWEKEMIIHSWRTEMPTDIILKGHCYYYYYCFAHLTGEETEVVERKIILLRDTHKSMTWLILSPFLPTSQLWWVSVNLERRQLCSPGAQADSHIRTHWDISGFRGFRCLCVSLPHPWVVNSSQHCFPFWLICFPNKKRTKQKLWTETLTFLSTILLVFYHY